MGKYSIQATTTTATNHLAPSQEAKKANMENLYCDLQKQTRV